MSSTIEDPRDVDVVLVMSGKFQLEVAPREARTLFLHADADARDAVVLGNMANKARWDATRDSGGNWMIRNDRELAVTRQRVSQLEQLLESLRKTARREEWPALSSGYRLEIERMQGEIFWTIWWKANQLRFPTRRLDTTAVPGRKRFVSCSCQQEQERPS